MLTKKDFKILLRSRSWEFMQNYRPSAFGQPLATYRWNNQPIYYRPGTSDPDSIYKILLRPSRKGEYWVPGEIAPAVILDIGAHIGCASIYFAHRFPTASIYAFEPMPANFALLERNIEAYPHIQAFPVALGEGEGTVEIALSAHDGLGNYGGFSFHYDDKKDITPVRMEHPSTYLPAIGVEQVDFIKIDTEGHEYDVLRSFDPTILSNVRWIIGELHGIHDFILLEYLSEWFDIELRKTLKKSLYMFNACNKTFLHRIPTPHEMVRLGHHRG